MSLFDRFDLDVDDALCIDLDREDAVMAELDFEDEILASWEHDVYDADPTGGQPSKY